MLRGRFDSARLLPGLPTIHLASAQDPRIRRPAVGTLPIGTTALDLLPAVLFSFASNPATYRRVDAVYRADASRYGSLASQSPLVAHPVFSRLVGIQAATARHLLGLLTYENADSSFHTVIDTLIQKSWHRTWQWVANHEMVDVGEYMTAGNITERERGDLDPELVILVWQARRAGRRIAATAEMRAFGESLLSWSVLLTLENMRPSTPPPPVLQRDAVRYFHDLWTTMVDGETVGTPERVLGRVCWLAEAVSGTSGQTIRSADEHTVLSACEALAERDPRASDAAAAEALAWMVALAQVSQSSNAATDMRETLQELQETRHALNTAQRREEQIVTQAAVSDRVARQTSAELERMRTLLQRRDAEIAQMRDRSARQPVEDIREPVLEPVTEHLVVAGGVPALAGRLRPWMPNASFLPEDDTVSVDTSIVRGCRAVIVLTSQISHARADRVSDEARRQGVPVILVGWNNVRRIVSTVRRALDTLTP